MVRHAVYGQTIETPVMEIKMKNKKMAMTGEDILKALWNKYYGTIGGTLIRTAVTGGGWETRIEIKFRKQNPEGKSDWAKAVKSGKIKDTDLYWLFIQRQKGEKPIWLGYVFKGTAFVNTMFYTDDQGRWHIYL